MNRTKHAIYFNFFLIVCAFVLLTFAEYAYSSNTTHTNEKNNLSLSKEFGSSESNPKSFLSVAPELANTFFEKNGVWINGQWDYAIPPLAGLWDVHEITSNPSSSDDQVIRQSIGLVEEGGAYFEIAVWENKKSLNLLEWFESYGRSLYADSARIEHFNVASSDSPGIMVYHPGGTCSFPMESFFIANSSLVFRCNYVHVDDGLNQAIFYYLLNWFDFNISDKSNQDFPPSPQANVFNKVDNCGGIFDSCLCNKYNPYPCCANGGNCTWYAWHKMCCEWGYGASNWRDAKTWAANAKADGHQVVSTPTVGSVACSTSGTYGHVAYVIAVSGSTVQVEEQNCCTGCHYGMRRHEYQASFLVLRHFPGKACRILRKK